MTTASWIALVLAVVALASAIRIAIAARRKHVSAVRTALRVAGLIASTALLYFFLQPPAGQAQQAVLKLLTANATAEDAIAGTDQIVLALPEAPAFANVARIPDLGTALRRHPSATRLLVRGVGLEVRDLDAARGRTIEFVPAALPSGITELSAPVQVPQGRRFTAHGRVAGAAGGRIELLDPAGQQRDAAALDSDGHFTLTAATGPAGRVDYRLRVHTADDTLLEELALPLDVEAGQPLRVWVLAGGPSPELKYLRRWALDAGLALRSQVSVGGGVEIGDPPLPFTAATLREFDLLVIDDRAWRDLGERGRTTLREAVREGLGVMLRLTADPGERERAVLREWGFTAETADIGRSLRLPGSETPDRTASPATDDPDATETQATDTAPLLSRRPLRLAAADGVALQHDDRGEVLALWRSEGRGRIAVWTLSDSFRLALAGRRAAHGSLWATAFSTLARPHGDSRIDLPTQVRAGERNVFCGLVDQNVVLAPDGKSTPLVPDPASRCAAYWPEQSGWHELQSGDHRRAFPVRAAEEGSALAAMARQEATRALAAASPAAETTAAASTPGSRWPWAIAWLLVSGLLWWLERRRP